MTIDHEVNPWREIPAAPPYVLPADRPHVYAFNRYLAGGPDHELDVSMFPEPFGGNPEAPLVLLARNPGIGAGDPETHHDNRAYVEALRSNVGGDTQELTYLRPEFRDTPGGRWWRKRCVKSLLETEHFDPAWLSQRILMVDYHAYHARNWRAIPFTLPSQSYGFALVRGAVERNAMIVALRGLADWTVAVPELDGYKHVIRTRNPQVSALSRGNLGNDHYERVLRAISAR